MTRKTLPGLLLGLFFTVTVFALEAQASSVRVAILPFQVHSGEDLSYLQKGIQDMLYTRVSQQGGVQVLDRGQMANLERELASSVDVSKAAAIGSKLGADFVVFGSISKLGAHVSLDGQVVDVRERSSKASLSAEAPNLDGVIPQVNRLAQEIRAAVLGQPVSSVRGAQPQAQAPPAASFPSAGLPQQQLVAPAPGVTYPVPPGGYPVPPGGFTGGKMEELFSRSDEDEAMVKAGGGGINPAFIMAYQADKMRRGYVKTPELSLSDIQSLDVGDVDGDGANEVVIADEDRIHIYKEIFTDPTKKVTLNPVPREVKILSMDVADVNRNGVAEIYVTAIREKGETITSAVVEYRGGKYEVIAKEVPYLFRVIRSTQEGQVLLGQQNRPRYMADRARDMMFNPFLSPVKLRWEGGKLVAGEEITLKDPVCVLGLTAVDVDRDGTDEYLGFDQRDYLKLFNARGGLVWVSSDPYGRTANFFLKDFKQEFPTTVDPPDPRVWLPPRIVTVDLDEDGLEEIVVCHNYEPLRILANSRFFTKSAVFSLSWDGVDFMENWRTREMKGYVSDYQVKDVDGDGNPELVVGLVYKRGTMDYLRTNAALIAFQLNVDKAKGKVEKVVKTPPKPPEKKDEGISIFPTIKF
ncbi:MAG: FG-GAP-like repeat-containing protein [Thermodesulfobacteriota bacterium]